MCFKIAVGKREKGGIEDKYSQPSISTGLESIDSTNYGWKNHFKNVRLLLSCTK